MGQWGNGAMCQCVNWAMCLATGLWIIKNLHVGKYDAGELFKKSGL